MSKPTLLGIAGAVIGGTIGFFLGGGFGALGGAAKGAAFGASLGFSVGVLIGTILFPPELPTQNGPQLRDKQVQTSTLGISIPWVWGGYRLAGNILWATEIVEVRKEEEIDIEGAKGFSGGSYTVISYEYFGNLLIGWAKGTHKVAKLWAEGKIIWTPVKVKYGGIENLDGVETQLPPSYIEGFEGAGNVPGYRELTCTLFKRLPLEDFGNRIPNFGAQLNGQPRETTKIEYYLDPDEHLIDGVNNTPFSTEQSLFRPSMTSPDGRYIYRLFGGDSITGDVIWDITKPKFLMSRFDTLNKRWEVFDFESEAYPHSDAGPSYDWDTRESTGTMLVAQDGDIYIGKGIILPGENQGEMFQIDPITMKTKGYTKVFTIRTDSGIASSWASDCYTITETSTHIVSYWNGAIISSSRNKDALWFHRKGEDFPGVGGFEFSLGSELAIPVNGTANGGIDNPLIIANSAFVFYLPNHDKGSNAYFVNDMVGMPDSPSFVASTGVYLLKQHTLASGITPRVQIQYINPTADISVDAFGIHPIPDDFNVTPWAGDDFNSPASTEFLLYDSFYDQLVIYGEATENNGELRGYSVADPLNLAARFATTNYDGTTYAIIRAWVANYNSINGIAAAYSSGQFVDPDDPDLQNADGIMLIDLNDGSLTTLLQIDGPLVADGVTQEISSWALSYNQNAGTWWWAPDSSDAFSNWLIEQWDFGYWGGPQSTLKQIADDVMDATDVPTTDRDTSALDGVFVDGYAATRQASGRKVLEPLQQLHLWDLVETEGKLKASFRGTTPVKTLTEEDLAVREFGDDVPPLLTEIRRQEVELPLELTLNYADPAFDYEVVAASISRATEATPSRNKLSIDGPIVLTSTRAKKLVEKAFYNMWTNRVLYEWLSTIENIILDPGDVINILAEGVNHEIYITSMDLGANNIIQFKGIRNDIESYVETVTDGSSIPINFVPQDILLPGSTTPVFLDLPLATVTTDQPGYFIGVSVDSDNWLSGGVFDSSDKQNFAQIGAMTVPLKSGFTISILATTLYPDVVDRVNTVRINMANAALTSVTINEVIEDFKNIFRIGDELVGAITITEVQTDIYDLSDLIRGAQGTEWAIGTHVNSEIVRYLRNDGSVAPVSQSLALHDESRFLTGVTSGQTLSEGVHTPYANTNIKLKPWAPAQVGYNSLSPPSGSTTFSFFRRARYDNEVSWDTDDLFILDESVLDFECDIYIDSTKAILLATITSIASGGGSIIDVNEGTVTYTALDKLNDGHNLFDDFYAEVFQISSRVGRGYAGTATISITTSDTSLIIEVPNASIGLQTYAARSDEEHEITVPQANLDITASIAAITNGPWIEVPFVDLDLTEATPSLNPSIAAINVDLSITAFAPTVRSPIEVPFADLTLTEAIPDVRSPIEIPLADLTLSTFVPLVSDSINPKAFVPAASLNLGDGVGDSDFEDVVLLLPFDGDDGDTTTLDYSPTTPHTMTFVNSAEIDTAQGLFGEASLKLIAATDDHLSAPDNADWLFGLNEPFTIEARVKFSVVPSSLTYHVVTHWNSGPGDRSWLFTINAASTISFRHSINGVASTVMTSTSTIPGNTVDWNHIAFTRDVSNVWRLFINGKKDVATNTDGAAVFDGNADLLIGAINSGGIQANFDGWMKDLRITKGVAKYVADFEVPSEPHPKRGTVIVTST